jgi:hypothetical protein
VGYSETSKAYRIFILAQRKKIVSRDVKFEENLAFRKSHELRPVEEDEEQEALKGEQRSEASNSGIQPLGGEELAPSSSVRSPKWFTQTLKDAQERVEALRSTVRRAGLQRSFQTSRH